MASGPQQVHEHFILTCLLPALGPSARLVLCKGLASERLVPSQMDGGTRRSDDSLRVTLTSDASLLSSLETASVVYSLGITVYVNRPHIPVCIQRDCPPFLNGLFAALSHPLPSSSAPWEPVMFVEQIAPQRNKIQGRK